jgi:hypothetical protein
MSKHAVEIEWDDACVVNGAWHDRAEVVSKSGRTLARVRSVGYVLYADKKVTVLASSFHHDRVGEVQDIPTKTIVRQRVLR